MGTILGEELGTAEWVRQTIRELHVNGIPASTHSNVYESSRVIKSGPGLLFGFSVYSSNVAAQFIQLHDSATLPADTAIPVAVFTIATIANLGVSYIFPGRFFSRGIVICNSTTGPTKTIGAADCFFDAQFA